MNWMECVWLDHYEYYAQHKTKITQSQIVSSKERALRGTVRMLPRAF